MPSLSLLAIGIGATLGAWLRWWLSLQLNPLFPTLPLGTLAANLLGGYLVGIAVGYFGHHSHLPAEARLLVITGFMGGLTTFSTFSSEAVNLLSREQYGWAATAAGLHLFGSLTMTALGLLTIKRLLTGG